MPITINGTTGLSGVDGSAGTPALQGSDSNTGIAFGADTIIGSTGGSERFRCDSSGRLLVGASTARSNLSYYGNTYTPQQQIEASGSSYNNGVSLINYSASGYGSLLTFGISKSNTKGTNTSVINGDELGSLHWVGNDGTNFVTAAVIRAEVDGTPGTNDMPGRLGFYTTADGASSPTERMRITNNGFLKATTDGAYTGIDTNSHGVRQTVSASWMWMAINNTASPYGLRVEYTGASPNGTDNPFLYCYDSTALRASIRSNGGLANFSANNVNLSDINTKKDITPISGTWDCIKEWEIVNFRYKDQPDDADLNLGVIAQQVAESCPEVITVFSEATEDEPEKLGVKEQQMYWMAIKALQEAQQRIESLETRLAALEVTP